MKVKTITVTAGWATRDSRENADRYRIEKLTDSIEYAPGDFLSPKQIETLCAARDWKVTILPFPRTKS